MIPFAIPPDDLFAPEWWEQSRRRRVKYFMPEDKNSVRLGTDLEDRSESGDGGYEAHHLWAHELFAPFPNYDGVLMPKNVCDSSPARRKAIEGRGVHKHLRLPRSMPVLGDSGAFEYVDDHVPPYSCVEMVDYYTSLGFDLGVSLDHMIMPWHKGEERTRRLDITLKGASEFMHEVRKRGAKLTAIGALQGWDAPSYAECAKAVVAMGYDYLAIGGVTKTPTREIIEILARVREAVGMGPRIHLFGIARLEMTKAMLQFNVTSVDSTSPFRQGVQSGRYIGWDGTGWGSVRVPFHDGSPRGKQQVKRGLETADRLGELELGALRAMKRYETNATADALDDILVRIGNLENAYLQTDTRSQGLLFDGMPATNEVAGYIAEVRRMLVAQPWRECGCKACEIGIDVVITRGANRSFRRGYHNTHVFYWLLGEAILKRDLSSMHGGGRVQARGKGWVDQPDDDQMGAP